MSQLYQSARIFTEPQIEVTLNDENVVVNVIEANPEIEVTISQAAYWGAIQGTLSNQTDLQNALNAKVPYTGATGNVNLGEYGITSGYVQLDTTPTTYTAAVGNIGWNDTVGTIETTLKGGNVVLKHGRDMFERIVNKTGGALNRTAYQAVRISTAQGQRLGVALAQANNDNNSADTIGLVVEDIAVNQEGYIYTVGEVGEINTTGSLQGETWADGDVLYLSPTTAGRITNVKPVAPQHLVVIGYVVYAHQNHGKIYVKVMNGWELGELHDVKVNNPLNGQVLKYNSTLGIWENNTDSAGTGTVTSISTSSPITGGTITTSGTIGIQQATGSQDGYLSATDWTTFNSKEPAITAGTSAQYWRGDKSFQTLNTTAVTEGTNLYFTNARAQAAISLTTTGTSGAATYTSGTLNIPQYQAALTNPVTGTGTSGQVSYWSGSTTQTGSNNLFWDAVNSRLGVGTNAPARTFDVNGLAGFTGTTASDGGQLGSELLSSSGWTLGAGWTGDFATGFAHSSGTATLTNTLAAVNGTYYRIGYTVTGRTAGSFTIAFGGYTSGNLTATGSVGPRATSTGTVVITPTTDFNGTIVLSIRVISASSASIQLRNSTGTITNEIRNDASNTNVIIGLNAGTRNLGTNNTFIGNNAGQNNTTAIGNLFVGISAGASNTIGESNSFVGRLAGQSNTTGNFNTAFGNTSLTNNTTGSSNSFFGLNSGAGNTAGNSNSGFGTNTGYNQSSGSNNIYFGLDAGRYISGGGNLTQSNNSVFIGNDTRANANSETNQTVIGYQAIGLGSNTTVIGNSSTTFGRWWGNLLIGTSTNAGQALQVSGTALFTGAVTGTGNSSTYTVTASSGVARSKSITSTLVASANNDVLVGLDINPTFTTGAFTGVTSFGLRLVNSALRIDYGVSGAITISNFSTNTFGANLRFGSSNAGSVGSASFGLWDGTRINGFFGHGGSNSNLGFSIGGAQVGAWFSTGNLFVGSSPTDAGFKLDVNGTARISGTSLQLNNGTSGTLDIFSSTPIINFFSAGGYSIGRSGTNMYINSSGTIRLEISSNAAYTFDTSNGHLFRTGLSGASVLGRITTGGNFVIGSITDNGYRLDVQGTLRVTGASQFEGNLTITDDDNLVFGTTTGTKIGTATSQKLGFWNATPIVQPTTAVAAATRVGGGGTTLTDTDTFDGYTLAQIVKALRNTGILA